MTGKKAAARGTEAVRHPLHRPSAEEFRGAIAPRREKGFDDLWRVAAFGLVEPSRGAPDPGERVLRETPLVGWNTEDRQACEAVVEREDEGGVG
jgi:hypothetical protein